MGISKKIAPTANTGFGTNASSYGGRLLNKDGSPNVRKVGVGIFRRVSWFHSMLSISRTKFFLIIVGSFVFINLLFTIVYYFFDGVHFAGMDVHSRTERFSEAFFFSAQTFTTVGYGRISPVGFVASAISAFEALIGLMSFALITGLLYGRFSKPRAYLRFSDNALISPYKEISALMVRVAPFKNTTLTDAEAKMTLALMADENSKTVNRFFTLDMELTSVNALTLSWTLVHPITEDSPLYNFRAADFQHARGEVLIYLKAFDDMFSTMVISRTSYTLNEVVYGAKFKPMYSADNKENITILDLTKLNSFDKAEIVSAAHR